MHIKIRVKFVRRRRKKKKRKWGCATRIFFLTYTRGCLEFSTFPRSLHVRVVIFIKLCARDWDIKVSTKRKTSLSLSPSLFLSLCETGIFLGFFKAVPKISFHEEKFGPEEIVYTRLHAYYIVRFEKIKRNRNSGSWKYQATWISWICNRSATKFRARKNTRGKSSACRMIVG